MQDYEIFFQERFVELITVITALFRMLRLESICSTRDCVDSAFLFLELIDPGVDPCADFYNFTCGNYKGEVITRTLQSSIDRSVRELILGKIEETDSRSVKLQKKYYQACMNLTSIEEDQNETIKKLFKKLGNWPVLEAVGWRANDFHWGKVVEKCKDVGLYYDWFINIDKSEYDNQLQVTPPTNVNRVNGKLKQRYTELITSIVKLLGAQGNSSSIFRSINDIVALEMELSKITLDQSVNPKKINYTVEDIENKFPYIPWGSLLKNVILPKKEKNLFVNDNYLIKLKELLARTPIRVQANYILWKITESLSAFLTYKIRREFERYSNVARPYQFPTNRENYCYGITSTVFAYVSEAEYVRRQSAVRKSVQDMVDNIKSVLYYHLGNAKWMSQSDRSLAFFKLRNMDVIIGGPEEMYDADGFDRLLGTDQIDLSDHNRTIEIICEVDKNRDLYNLDFVKPKHTVDQARFYQGSVMLSHTKYLPDQNIMFLSAAALEAFYSPNRPNYLNYGALGNVIAHELVHGFGLLGNVVYEGKQEKILWTNYTYTHFLSSAECLLENCNKIGIDNNFWMNCKDTFEESFADYVGVNLAYEAYKRLQRDTGEERDLPGLTYNPFQLFWMTYTSIMCNKLIVNVTEYSAHMLPFQRIIGAFRNSDYFSEDFSCPVGSNMNPAAKCKIL